MKINENIGKGRVRGIPLQFVRIMKLTILIMTVFLLQVSAASNAQITLKENKASLRKVLKSISKQSGYDFIYSIQDLDKAVPVSVNLDNASISRALELCFDGQPLIYELSEKTVMVRAKEDKGVFARIIDRLNAFEASGKVVDAEGKPLPGATIRVKNGKGSTLADANGRFTLGKVEEGTVLVISYTGYVSKEVVASVNMGNIVLELSLSKLDEVQVIAYGTTTQRLSTGNVTTIKADVIEKQPVNNPLLALQGRVPGLFIEQATGFAGTGVKVRIQGQNSFLNGNDPLYVIDGVPYNSQLIPGGNSIIGSSGGTNSNSTSVGSPLNFINPSDIESIDVLKDADATAIYGSRASNGAILITTKKGKQGNTRIDLNVQSGIAKIPRKLDLMNTDQYLEMRREALINDGLTAPGSGPYGDNDLNGNWDNSSDKDWQKELLGKNAVYQDLGASVSGGNDKTSFLISAGHHRETNVFPGDYSDNKSSLHFNISSSSLNQKFKIQFSGSYLFDKNLLPRYDLTKYAMTIPSVAPNLYNEDGSLNWGYDPDLNASSFYNPLNYTKNNFLAKTTNLVSSMLLSYQIMNGLELKTSLGYTSNISKSIDKTSLESTAPEYVQYSTPTAMFTDNDVSSWNIEPQLTYHKHLGRGNLETLLGITFLQTNLDGKQIFAYGFANDLVSDDIMSASTVDANSSISSVYKYNALFGRLNYNWEDRYILNLTGRRDGSSRFGPKSQFHNFASLGAAWIFSNESFIKNNQNFLTFGKLRASYGTTGNDQINDYGFMSLYSPLTQGVPYQGITIYAPTRLTNQFLEWEETKKLQFGLDLGFVNDKVLVNVNYYQNRSSNQLAGYTLPVTTGFTGIVKNQGYKIQNSGWELAVSSVNYKTTKFSWNSSINLTIPKSLLISFPEIYKSSANTYAIIGRPLSIQYVYHYLGVDPATGNYLFEDKEGNPTTTPSDPSDKTVMIDLSRKFYGGIQNTLTYKGLELDFLFSFTKQIAQNYNFGNMYTTPGGFGGGAGNQIYLPISKRWQKPGDIATIERYTAGYDLYESNSNVYKSDAAWTDASYIRLKNVSLSWQLPEHLSKAISMDKCSLFIRGQNLWTLTSYNGLDPESKSSLTLPPLRVLTFGFKIIL